MIGQHPAVTNLYSFEHVVSIPSRAEIVKLNFAKKEERDLGGRKFFHGPSFDKKEQGNRRIMTADSTVCKHDLQRRQAMEMKYRVENRQLTIRLGGELDHHAAKNLMDSIDRLLEQHLPAKTFLDLGELTFMDSSGIAVVLRVKRRMEALSGSLMVINIPRQAARVLETAGLARYVNLC